MPNDAKARRGGKLEDMAVHGTSIPSDSGTQHNVPSSCNKKAESAYDTSTLYANLLNPAIADNTIDMPSRGDGGLTGGVVTSVGDQLPADVEAKRVGQDSSGGGEHRWVEAYVEGSGEQSDTEGTGSC